jgi:two-component system, chemotaxis family, protein-glutamate methylesterase/glutaminase
MGGIRVVLADDCRMARHLLRSFLEGEGDFEVVGEARDGREAVELAFRLRPDVLTMDLEMPVMGGLEAIAEIMGRCALPILVVSSAADAPRAFEAVRLGALDVMAKPTADPAAIKAFAARVRLLSKVPVITHLRTAFRAPSSPAEVLPAPAAPLDPYPRVFALAASTGGPQALAQVLRGLPAGFPCPVLVAQHISDGFAAGMVSWLGSLCPLPVVLAEGRERLQPGVVYVSPAERHLVVQPSRHLLLRERGASDLFHPSCDALLRSVGEVFGSQAVGLILTGMSSDGVQGLACIRERGGVTLAQDEATSVIFGMNRSAIEAGAVQRVLPLEALAPEMVRLARSPVRP